MYGINKKNWFSHVTHIPIRILSKIKKVLLKSCPNIFLNSNKYDFCSRTVKTRADIEFIEINAKIYF